jgi:hypothetical protein
MFTLWQLSSRSRAVVHVTVLKCEANVQFPLCSISCRADPYVRCAVYEEAIALHPNLWRSPHIKRQSNHCRSKLLSHKQSQCQCCQVRCCESIIMQVAGLHGCIGCLVSEYFKGVLPSLRLSSRLQGTTTSPCSSTES